MTKQKDLKALVRERMAKTGESYQTAHAVVVQRGRGGGSSGPPPPDPVDIVYGAMHTIAGYLVNSDDAVTGETAMTNADDFGYDDGIVRTATFIGPDRIEFEAWMQLAGDHDDEKPFGGDTVTLDIVGTLVKQGDEWDVEDVTTSNVASNAYDDEGDDD